MLEIKTPGLPSWAIYLIMGVVSMGGLYGAHALYSGHYVNQGVKQCEKARAALDKQAVASQSDQNQGATIEQAKVKVETEIVYQTKIKEVVKYVPPKDSGSCLPDPEFLRLFNQGGDPNPTPSK